MKISFFLVINFLVAISVCAQGHIIIKGFSEDPDLKIIKVSPPLRDCIKGWVHLAEIAIDSNHHFFQSVNIQKPTIIYIHASDYVESFVMPGDTIELYVKKLNVPKELNDGIIQLTQKYEVIIKSNKNYNSFFSILENETGKMKKVPFLINDDISVSEKDLMIKKLYERRKNFLNHYLANNPSLSEDFKSYASNEIRGEYLCNILLPIVVKKQQVPIDYLKEIANDNFKWSDVENSQYLMMAAKFYFSQTQKTYESNILHYNSFESEFNSIVESVKDTKLRDYFLSALMAKYYDKKIESYKKILSQYLQICEDAELKEEILSLNNSDEKIEFKQKSKLSSNALSTLIFDTEGSSFSLSSLLTKYKNKLVLLDFWASWCGPCIIEIPYLKKISTQFDSQIIIISISEDNNLKSWLSCLKRNYSIYNNQYIFNAKSNDYIKKELSINKIPRYVLLNPNGEILQESLPKPSDTENIETILKNAIKEKLQ